jgi:hypothetical protein
MLNFFFFVLISLHAQLLTKKNKKEFESEGTEPIIREYKWVIKWLNN